MDTSELRIRMSDCPEIQDGHVWVSGDYWWNLHGGIHLCTGEQREPYHPLWTESIGKSIWLPDQSQLQEMVGWRNGALIYLFMDWHTENHEQTDTIASMEQLWLAFVMKELHNKLWNGKGWERVRLLAEARPWF